MANKLKLTRNQLASFLKSHEEIKQFERLILLVEEKLNTGTVDDIESFIGSALAAANTNAAAIQAIADTLDMQPTPQRDNSVVTDYIDLPETGPHVTQARRVQWNSDDGTMDVGLYGGSVLQVGQEMHYYAKNTSGATITNGSPVIVTGTIGASGKLEIGLAIGNNSIDQRYFIGAATQNIAKNAFGYVTSFGLLRSYNTSAWADGDLLYVSDTVAGTWTNVAPTAPKWHQAQAIVVHAHVNGSIFMRATPEHAIGDLRNVIASGATSGELLSYNGTVWVNTGVITADLTNNTGRLIDSSATLTNGAGALLGTLTNAPTAGDPTKWVAIDDNGTTRYIPAW